MMSEAKSRVRLGITGIVVMALFCGLFARLWFLQIASSESFAAQTEQNRVRVLHESATRGTILDTNGREIVESAFVNTIRVRRGLTDEEREAMVPNLAEVLDVTQGYINKRLDSVRYSPYEAVPIKNGVSFDKLVYIKERPEMFPKVDVVRRSVRLYPVFEELAKIYPSLYADTTAASHLLGYVGAINKDEQKLHKGEGYGPDDVIGKGGVEQVFETELRGNPRKRKLEIDSRGRLVQVLNDRPAEAGNDVQLTMDIDIQRIADESLVQGMRNAGYLQDTSVKDRFKTYGAKGGAVIVLDATDGSVIAMASRPSFDIREFTYGTPFEKFAALNDPASNSPLLNRVIQGEYAPGSTWKTFTALAALQTGIVDPEVVVIDRGFIEFGDEPNVQTFKNAKKEAHGAVKLRGAIQVSSDVYFYALGFKFWRAFSDANRVKGYAIQNLARDYGFGDQTGIGLPDEHFGRIPDQKFKATINKGNPDSSTQLWLPGDSAALAVGQGDLLVTPLQLAAGYAAFANGGTLYQPRLARLILTPGGQQVLREIPSQPVTEINLDPTIRAQVMDGLKDALIGIGSAQPAFSGLSLPTGWQVAGKTGTAEVFGKQDTSVFAGILNPDPPEGSVICAHHELLLKPGCIPQYVVVSFIEEGGFGASVAAPIVRRIMEAIGAKVTPSPADDIPPKVRVIREKKPGSGD
ncbi:MAG: penicillin-binding protein 2 [Actinobacteria bacterium]|nr:penicillin-binding protein 2 [Actinomycetota bacterium]